MKKKKNFSFWEKYKLLTEWFHYTHVVVVTFGIALSFICCLQHTKNETKVSVLAEEHAFVEEELPPEIPIPDGVLGENGYSIVGEGENTVVIFSQNYKNKDFQSKELELNNPICIGTFESGRINPTPIDMKLEVNAKSKVEGKPATEINGEDCYFSIPLMEYLPELRWKFGDEYR